MYRIEKLIGREILDSRGRPTVEATCVLTSGHVGTCSVPSGASTGAAEAIELRDGDPTRYGGLGCRRAAQNISTELHASVVGRAFEHQSEWDSNLIAIDGSSQKSRLGANAILAASLAFARAQSHLQRIPLHQYFSQMAGYAKGALPQLTVNLFSGGRHAGGQVPVQDVLLVPQGERSIDESLSMVASVYQAAVRLIDRKYQMRLLRADEGGLAPPFPDAQSMLDDAVECIAAAGWEPMREIAIAVDVASSHFYEAGQYRFGQEDLSSSEMVERLASWIDHYPIVSLEDALAENDWEAWPKLNERLGDRVLVLGDDLLCTNPERIRRAIECRAANALLLKVNQIGTLTEAVQAMQLARSARWRITASARSGETEDNWLADLAVGWNAEQIKVGSITQSERLAKYNRLLAIETDFASFSPQSI